MTDADTNLFDAVKKGLSYGKPNLDASTLDANRMYLGKVASDFVSIGEPGFAPPKFWTRLILAFLALAILQLYYLTGMDSASSAGNWIFGHQITSGLFLLVCLSLALFVGSVRQVFNKLMATAGAMEIMGDDGRVFLSYLGDVPPFRWQYSVWPRVKSWMIVAGASICAAFIAAELIAGWTDASREVVFWIILGVRWLLSSIPALLCIDRSLWSRMSPPS